MLPGSSPITFTSPSSKTHQKWGPFLSQRYPASTVADPVKLSAMAAAFSTLRTLPSPSTGLPRLPEPPFRRAVPATPADRTGARVDCFPAHTAFPKWQEVGIRIVTFEACSGFTHVTARRIAQPPNAAFVTRLQSRRLPDEPLVSYQINRQLRSSPLVIRAFGGYAIITTSDNATTASMM